MGLEQCKPIQKEINRRFAIFLCSVLFKTKLLYKYVMCYNEIALQHIPVSPLHMYLLWVTHHVQISSLKDREQVVNWEVGGNYLAF